MFTVLALFACGTPEAAHDDHEVHEAHGQEKAAHHDGHEAEGHDHDHGEAKTAAATASADGWSHYGEPFAMDSAKPCKELTADPESHVDQVVRVEGHVENVCQKKGCWMVVADEDGEYVRITMKDHAFGVPTDTKTGKDTRVDVEGKLIKKVLDAETLAHLKSEAKGDEADLEKQFAPKYEIVATGVALKQM